MELVGNIYFIIFLPLISSFFCYLVFKKTIAFTITVSCLLSIFLLLLDISKEVFFYEKILVNPASKIFSSISLDFKIDIISFICLLLVIFVKIICLIFSYQKVANKPFQKTFYAIYLVNIFGLIGVFLSSNLLNLLIFLEVYSLSFIAILLVIKNKNLLAKTIEYFYINSSSFLILLLCFFVFFFAFNSFNLSQISINSSLILQENSKFLIAVFTLIFFSIFCKLMPLNIYLAILKTPKLSAQYLLPDIILTKSILLIFLIIKFYSFFSFNGSFFSDNFVVLTFIILAILFSVYCSYQIFFQKKSKSIALNLVFINISTIFLVISTQEFYAYRLLFFYLLNFVITVLAIFWLINFVKSLKFSVKFIKILILATVLITLNLGFLANIYFTYSLLNFNFKIIILPALLFSIIAQFMANINLAKNLFLELSYKKIPDSKIFQPNFFWHNLSYILLFFLASLNFLLIYFLPILNESSLKFSAYLLTNVI